MTGEERVQTLYSKQMVWPPKAASHLPAMCLNCHCSNPTPVNNINQKAHSAESFSSPEKQSTLTFNVTKMEKNIVLKEGWPNFSHLKRIMRINNKIILKNTYQKFHPILSTQSIALPILLFSSQQSLILRKQTQEKLGH